MLKRRFGKTELKVSPLGFGGAEIGVLDVSPEQISTLLNGLLDRGVNVIDTAAMYKASERLINEAIGPRRSEFVLISKCGHGVDDIQAEPWSAELIRQSVDRSLQALGTDHLDVMLLHSCDLETLKRGDAWAALVECRDAGKVRFIGYSGDNQAAVYAAELAELSVIQTSVNICDQHNIDSVLPACAANDIGVMIKRPMANAAWRKIDDQPGGYSNYAQTYTDRLRAMAVDPTGDGADAGLDWANMALRFTLGQTGVHTAIVGTTNPANIDANLRAAGQPPLGESTVAQIRDAFATAQAAAGEPWIGQT